MVRPKSPIKEGSKSKKEPNGDPIVVRVPKEWKKKLQQDGKISDKVRQLIEKSFKQTERYSQYKCDNCDEKIKVGDFYFINLEHVEKYISEDEIEVITSIPTKIKCAKCSTTKIGQLMAEKTVSKSKIKESKRTVED